MMLPGVSRLHFVGIGGVGMCALAEVLIASGCEVSGCDLAPSDRLERLAALGAAVVVGHDPGHVRDVDAVVVSAAVGANDAELAAARAARVPVVRRADLLAELMRTRLGIAVAGTHGKTTTTAMVGAVLDAGGLDPTVVAGGRVAWFSGHGRLGAGRFLVCEADEFDQSFLALRPVWSVVTNVEPEHLECYGSVAALETAFADFAGSIPFYGSAVICVDDPGARRLSVRLDRRVVTYGLAADAEVRADAVTSDPAGSRFRVVARGAELGEARMPLPGRHNVANALAAIAVGLELGLPFGTVRDRLARFTGVARRFEILGERDGVTVVDDYAHHPTEVRATLEAARQAFPGRRLVAVFQPHLYTRTQEFADGFGEALASADRVLVLPIYPAREHPIAGVTSALILAALRSRGHGELSGPESCDAALGELKRGLRSGDVMLTLGAGDVDRVGVAWLGGGA